MVLISVIIPTHNRYKYLLNSIKSVLNQTYKKFELIIVNDGSTQSQYNNLEKDVKNIKNELNISNNVQIINLDKSSKNKLGYPCGAVPRNEGLKNVNGEYICFLDDDDIWMSNKLEIQINEMIKNNLYFSCTDGYIGNGFFDKNIKYKIYNEEFYKNIILKKIELKEYPDIITKNILNKHNLIITSSVCFYKKIIDDIGIMKLIKNGGEIINGIKQWQDYDYWLRILEKHDCLYIKFPLIYYDNKI